MSKITPLVETKKPYKALDKDLIITLTTNKVAINLAITSSTSGQAIKLTRTAARLGSNQPMHNNPIGIE